AAAAEAPAAPDTAAESDRVPVFASPSVRRFAREVGVDIRRVEGTGPGGRISVDDVKAAARNLGRLAPTTDKPVGPDLPEFSRWGAIRVEPLNRVRQAAAKFLHESWTTIPHVTVFDQADVTDLEAWRLSLRRAAERAGVKITVTSILIKLVAKALAAHPMLNASLDLPGGQMVLKDHYHIGVAVDTDRGLVVPTLRDVDQKSLFDVAREMTELAEAGRRGKLAPNDMAGASFTVTNLGGIGIGYFTPIIPHPQVGILGVGRAVKQPVWNEEKGEFAPRLLMPLSLSFDHRLVDGADGARFLRWMIDAMEQPLLLLNA
ncbi:MAG TPA: branched-chain alpha-keto acid dehydrogenase subunit E2, partial [Armatimonadetes bacterium]|nr:branched-chain alpha-keto acid dehydrogenase subunit E2 [Armatimonadota bacterium]